MQMLRPLGSTQHFIHVEKKYCIECFEIIQIFQRMLEPKMQRLERYVTRNRNELWKLRMQALEKDPNSLSNADPFGPYH